VGTEGNFQVYAALYSQVPDTTTLKIRNYDDMLPWYNYDGKALTNAFINPVKQKVADYYGLDVTNEEFDSIFKLVYPFEFSLLDKNGSESKPALDIAMNIPNNDVVKMLNDGKAQIRVFIYDKNNLYNVKTIACFILLTLLMFYE
jgi:hypothetical protein